MTKQEKSLAAGWSCPASVSADLLHWTVELDGSHIISNIEKRQRAIHTMDPSTQMSDDDDDEKEEAQDTLDLPGDDGRLRQDSSEFLNKMAGSLGKSAIEGVAAKAPHHHQLVASADRNFLWWALPPLFLALLCA
eukprot:g42016.t1